MSDEELSRLLSELNETAQELNEASDSINSIILSIEQKIIASNVGTECWLTSMPIYSGEPTSWNDDNDVDHSELTETILGFAKLDQDGGGWRLAVRERRIDNLKYQNGEQDEKIDYWKPTALWRASRELRIRSLEKLPDLIKLLSLRAKNALEAISRAKKLVE